MQNKTITLEQLKQHLASLEPTATTVALNLLLNNQYISCVDGRNTSNVIASPGGNSGLFLQMAAAYESFTDSILSDTQISELFNSYLTHFGHFYMHSDTHALEKALKKLQSESSITISSLAELKAQISTPSEEVKDMLLAALLVPDHTGCGHLRLMMEKQDIYKVRYPLIEAFIRNFFSALWNGNDAVIFDILEGDHAECAIINVDVQEKNDSDDIPLVLIAPQFDGMQVFINHPSATTYLHKQHVTFLYNYGLIGKQDQASFFDHITALHNTQLGATVEALGAGLPVFNFSVEESLTEMTLDQVA